MSEDGDGFPHGTESKHCRWVWTVINTISFAAAFTALGLAINNHVRLGNGKLQEKVLDLMQKAGAVPELPDNLTEVAGQVVFMDNGTLGFSDVSDLVPEVTEVETARVALRLSNEHGNVTFRMPAANGAENQYLYDPGTGNLTWASLPTPPTSVAAVTSVDLETTFTFPNDHGQEGQMLYTDGEGGLYFEGADSEVNIANNWGNGTSDVYFEAPPTFGTDGHVLVTRGNGTTDWVELAEAPEAPDTVFNGALSNWTGSGDKVFNVTNAYCGGSVLGLRYYVEDDNSLWVNLPVDSLPGCHFSMVGVTTGALKIACTAPDRFTAMVTNIGTSTTLGVPPFGPTPVTFMQFRPDEALFTTNQSISESPYASAYNFHVQKAGQHWFVSGSMESSPSYEGPWSNEWNSES